LAADGAAAGAAAGADAALVNPCFAN